MAKTKKTPQILRWFVPFMRVMANLGTAQATEVLNNIADYEHLDDDFVNQQYEKTGANIFRTQVWFVRQYLTWEGYIYTPQRSVWSLTDLGAIKAKNFSYEDAKHIYNKWRKIKNELNRGKTKPVQDTYHDNDSISDPVSEQVEELNLLEIVRSLPAEGFEKLCGELLRRYNFENVQVTQRSHDGGIDGYAILKINPFVNYRVAFQCKRYKGAVSLDEVKAFCYSARNYDRMLFITTGTFSKEARRIEEQDESKLELIDGNELVGMFEKINMGVMKEVRYIPDPSFFERFL